MLMDGENTQSRFESRGDLLDELDKIITQLNSATASETMELCRVFTEDLATAVAQDQITESTKQECLSSLCENVPFTKSHLQSQYDSAYESHTSTSTSDIQHFDEWLRDHVEKLEVVRSTDSHIDTSYVWTFDDGTVIETEREQFDWSEFSRVLTAANYEFTFCGPSPQIQNKAAWKFDFLQPFLREHAESRLVTGSRSDAILELQNTIQSTRAFRDVQQAYQTTGIYVDEDDSEYVYVASAVITKIADEQGVTTRAMQVECDARGIVDGSVSVRLCINGNRQSRFWRLPQSFAEPQTEPQTEPEPDSDDDNNDSRPHTGRDRAGSPVAAGRYGVKGERE